MRQALYLAWDMFLYGHDIGEILSFLREGLIVHLFFAGDDE